VKENHKDDMDILLEFLVEKQLAEQRRFVGAARVAFYEEANDPKPS